MVKTQMKVSDVFHMQPSLPQILSCLLIHLPFPSHSPQLPLSHIFTPTIARCQTRHGTLLTKCTTGVSPLHLLGFFMKLIRMYCLWNIYFFKYGQAKLWAGGACWCMQAVPWHILLASGLKPKAAGIFYTFYLIPKYNVQLLFLSEEYQFQIVILPEI